MPERPVHQSVNPLNAEKAHIVTLDGLRGIAALAVLGHHIDYVTKQTVLFAHAYLAVDFFFLLSGFVMARAYERKMSQCLSFIPFTRMRLARLYPMVLVGAAFGSAIAVFEKHDIVLAAAAQLAFVPFVVSRNDAFPLNNVQWSLFFELFVNGLHARFHRWLSTPILAVVVAVTGLAVVLTNRHFGSLSVGYSWTNFVGGFPRVLFSYFAGVIISRLATSGRLTFPSTPFLGVAGILVVLLAAPATRLAPDALFVMVLFPLVLIAALRSKPPHAIAAVAAWMGAISYPLYAIHVPLLQAASLMIPSHASVQMRTVLWGLTVVIVLASAWGLESFYDAPIRRWLAQKRLVWAKPARNAAPGEP